MKRALRLAFVLPALLACAPAVAEPTKKPAQPIRYVTLDKMIRDYAAQARAHAARPKPAPAVVVAQR
jgi:hypothetical protein